jgi:hypothetical protein
MYRPSGELDTPQDRHLGDVRRRATGGRGPNLVQHVVVADILVVQGDIGIVESERFQELVVEFLLDLWVRSVGPTFQYWSVPSVDSGTSA